MGWVKKLARVSWLCAASLAGADQFTVAPAGAETTEQSATQQGPLAAGARSYQLLIMPSELSAIPIGAVMTSIQLRQDNGAGVGWPASSSTAASFVVKLGTSSLTPGTLTTTFANNVSGSFTTVYNSALTFGANALPGGANTGTTPEDFGTAIVFTQPYVYGGGALLIEIRSSGFVGAASVAGDGVVVTSTTMRGLFSNASSSATTGTLTTAMVVRLGFGTTTPALNPAGTTKLYLAEDFAATAAGSSFGLPFSSTAASMESVVLGSEFDGVGLGSEFVGMTSRSGSVAASPAGPVIYTAYDVQFSRAVVAPGAMSDLLASNRAGDTVTTRSGILSIPVNTFAPRPALGVTAPFSFELAFGKTYSYRGGNVDVYVSHNASSPSSVLSTESALESHPMYNSVFQTRFSTNQSAGTLVSSSAFPVMRLSVDAQAISPRLAAQGSNALGQYSGLLGNSSVVQQWIIGADELSGIPPGSLITSLSVRAFPGQPAWPPADAETTDFEVSLSDAGSAPGAMSTTFSDNQRGAILLVRDGVLVLEAGSIPAGSTGVFGTPIDFQRGYVYEGGNLCVTVRHSAFDQAGPLLDASNPAGANKVVVASPRTAITGSFLANDSGAAIRLGYTPSIAVPANRSSSAGSGGAIVWNTPLVYQVLVDQSQLPTIPVGSSINGIAFRIDDGAGAGFVTWPPAVASLNQFDVDISTSPNTAATMSSTFAANEGPSKTPVHAGPLTLPADSMPVVGADIGEHGFFVEFTKPFVYQGGTMCVTMHCGTLSGAASVAFDAQSGTTGSAARRFVGSSSGTTGLSVPVPVLRLAFTPKRACAADLNGDGVVDDADFVIFATAYDILLTGLGDFNFDGQVDDTDFVLFAAAYDLLICP